MIYLLSLIIFLEIIYINALNDVACLPKLCQNGGKFSNVKCKCECYPNYAGDLCQITLCNIDQPIICSDFVFKDCSLPIIYNYCPILCQKCPKITTCMYGQIYDETISKCVCVPGFSGELCEYFDCNSKIEDAEECAVLDCSIPIEVSSCPRSCGAKCLPPLSANSSTVFSCMYDQIFDINTSSCKCLPGFSGKKCEYFDCDSKIEDAEECSLLDCSTPIQVGSCPRQCSALCLNSKYTTTTPSNNISLVLNTTSSIILDRNILRQWYVNEDLLSNLATLNLENKNIESIQPATFNGLEKVEYLYLNGNKLKILAASVFWSLKNLRVLELWNNNLSYLPPNLFKNLDKLEKLLLDVNQMRDIQPNLFQSGLSQLKILDLSSNKFNKINENTFSSLKNLTYLGLSNNDLTELNEIVFRNLSSLQILNLSENKLSNLSLGLFAHLFQLKELRLENNRLSNLAENIFSEIKNVNILGIYLNGNPIVLDQPEFVKGLCKNKSKCFVKT